MKNLQTAKTASVDVLAISAAMLCLDLLQTGMLWEGIAAGVFGIALIATKHFLQNDHPCKK